MKNYLFSINVKQLVFLIIAITLFDVIQFSILSILELIAPSGDTAEAWMLGIYELSFLHIVTFLFLSIIPILNIKRYIKISSIERFICYNLSVVIIILFLLVLTVIYSAITKQLDTMTLPINLLVIFLLIRISLYIVLEPFALIFTLFMTKLTRPEQHK